MCNPGFVAVGAQAASSLAGYVQASKNAKAQDAAADLNQAYANQTRRRNISALNDRLDQEREASGQRMEDIERAAAQYQGRNAAQGAAAGVTGVTQETILQEVDRAAARAILRERTNLNATTEQITRQKQAVVDQQYASILRVPRGVKPSPLSVFLQIGGAAANAYADGLFDGVESGEDSIGGNNE